MSMTTEQETLFLSRLSSGELPVAIMDDMGVSRADMREFSQSHRQEFFDARAARGAASPVDSKARRLARLNLRKSALEERLVRVNQKIAGVEAE